MAVYKMSSNRRMKNKHTYHIPVMGIGFTIDTALKVARYGIDSVLSLSGQPLQEKLRKLHSEEHGLPYEEITEKDDDYRAKRTTAYLNLLNDLITQTFEKYKNSPSQHLSEIEKYIDLLPNNLELKAEYLKLLEGSPDSDEFKNWIATNLEPGSIDVNIMTKLDRENYSKGEKLPPENNDGHAALRGYANSKLSSSLILSAGLNPRLFTYMEQFDDFFPDNNGNIKKKIILKVSDYRSALVQGMFLAKKGLWITEYRIESGLNCGGHAFATEGYLMGPILAEFKQKREELFDSVFDVLKPALEAKGRFVSKEILPFKFTAQGGVGTSEEHQFLLKEYSLNSIGWGSPFLLVPEVTNVDDPTINKLINAKQDDFYLSNISPLGVRFNSLRGTSKEEERLARIAKGKPGSACIEGNLALFNKEFTEIPICTASRQYQKLAIKNLNEQELKPNDYQKKFDEIVEKTCLCTGLINSVLIINDLKTPTGNEGVSICPGPNMFYFKKIMSLREITDHIYGRHNIPFPSHRPNMFVKELYAYLDYISDLIDGSDASISKKEQIRLVKFAENLKEGIGYYSTLFKSAKDVFSDTKTILLSELDACGAKLNEMHRRILGKNVVTTA